MDLLNQSIEAAGHRWKVLFLPTGGESHERGWMAIVMARRTRAGGITPWHRTLIERVLRKTVPSEMVKGKGRTPEEALDWLRQELRRGLAAAG
jgi:hypothetical protein